MAFRKSGTSRYGFVPVCKVGLELLKIYTYKIKKIPILKQNSTSDWLGLFLKL